jgi:trans-2,3-dihydro-3-hydroxyanthranilate isomerase
LARRYAVLDVFTDRPLAGNPLAVVLDSEGLDSAAMQLIAAEFGLPETVFVAPAERPGTTAKVRIFTPERELQFAGHPTLGTAVLLASERLGNQARETDAVIVLEEGVGLVRCGVVVTPGSPGRAVFDLPRLPEALPLEGDVGMAASALGLDKGDIGFENHRMTRFVAGGPDFVFVPVADREAIGNIRLNMTVWEGAFGGARQNVYAYTRDCVHADGDFHARMFGPDLGIGEDPATGSAAAALAGVVMRFDGGGEGDRTLVIEQGYAMGRPSRMVLELLIDNGKLTGGRLGGSAVIVARGELLV